MKPAERKEWRKAWKNRKKRAPRIVAQLQRMLEDPVPEVRAQAVKTLHGIDAKNPVSFKAIARLFADPVPFVREEVGSDMDHSDGDLDLIKPIVRELLASGPPEERMEAALFLAEGGDTSPDLVPALLHALDHAEMYYGRANAARGLAQVVPRADAAIEPLKKALTDADDSVRAAAAEALLQMTPIAAATLDALIQAFRKATERGERRVYYDALVSAAAHVEAVVPYLIEVLESDETWELRRASELLGAVGPAGKAAVPALEKLLEHRDVNVAESARAALAAIRGA